METPARRRPAPDAFLQICPSREVLARLGDKWSLLALVALEGGAVRFGALRRRLQGVSAKMLTQTLQHLERDGLVERRVRTARPLAVDYGLTERGASLVPLARSLKAWAEQHLLAIARSQERFDRRRAAARSGL